MPIIAIEGPDKCGKSTLFAKLRDSGLLDAKFIVFPSFGKERMHIADALALRDLELWEVFYNPKQLYVCDRHVIVSDAVYSQLYNRPKLRSSMLTTQLAVLYIDVAIAELEHRHSICNEDVQKQNDYATVRRLYDNILQYFPCHILSAYATVEEAATSIKELVYDIS